MRHRRNLRTFCCYRLFPILPPSTCSNLPLKSKYRGSLQLVFRGAVRNFWRRQDLIQTQQLQPTLICFTRSPVAESPSPFCPLLFTKKWSTGGAATHLTRRYPMRLLARKSEQIQSIQSDRLMRHFASMCYRSICLPSDSSSFTKRRQSIFRLMEKQFFGR